jgi:hypothetical protein
MEKHLDFHVDLGDDTKYTVKGEGKVMFHLELRDSLDAHDVIYVPSLKKNFLSVLVMVDRGFFVTF